MSTQPDPVADAWRDIVLKSRDDEAYKQELLKDPAAVLNEHGFEVPDTVKVVVLENQHDLVHLVLPSGEISADVPPGSIDASGISEYFALEF